MIKANRKQVGDRCSGSLIIWKECYPEEQIWQEMKNNRDVIMMDVTVRSFRTVVRRTQDRRSHNIIVSETEWRM